jgi:hypothetical protein
MTPTPPGANSSAASKWNDSGRLTNDSGYRRNGDTPILPVPPTRPQKSPPAAAQSRRPHMTMGDYHNSLRHIEAAEDILDTAHRISSEQRLRAHLLLAIAWALLPAEPA